MSDLPRFGILIKVNDLTACRVFYRDLLELGEPVFDSTFQTVFLLGNDLSLTLELSEAKYLERASTSVLWSFVCDDIEKLRSRLENAGYSVRLETNRRDGGSCLRGCDPEGNFFLVRSAAALQG